ncbi:MAG: family 20 glycosylhydrolase [Bacteroidales bacterium]|nr:family 20 glycosylhydrolase [Bacteroidales bacterium]
MKKYALLLLTLVFSMNIFAVSLQEYLVPTPQKIDIQTNTAIAYDEYQFIQMSNYLAQFNLSTWEDQSYFSGTGSAIIKLTLRVDPQYPNQEYRLLIKNQSVNIIGGQKEAIYYGIQTLRQILAYGLSEKAGIPELLVSDYPAISSRGLMLDISRNKVPTMQTLYQLVDWLSSLKINEFQLYTEHAFAYKEHEIVWKDFSPMTPEEIAALQKYCNDRFIDLVPNQNSFGHFENWLRYDKYLPLADCVEDCATIWGAYKLSSLDPSNPGSFELVKGLYAELLPNFNSSYFNIGCDETVELGLGRSKAACDSLGVGRVYLNYLLKLNEEVRKYGKVAQFWGDIILNHEDLIPEIPKDMIPMVWGYDSKFRFDTILPKFRRAGLDFYVCPGTSTWRSIIGKNNIAFTNLRNAAIYGKENHAKGMLVTNWGDHGHWQPLSVCYAPMMVGCSYAWNCDTSVVRRAAFLLNEYVFNDKTQNTGLALMRLGNAYEKAKIPEGVANIFHVLLNRYAWKMKNQYQTKEITVANLRKTEAEIDSALQILKHARPECADANIVLAEIEQATDLAKHALHLGIERMQVKSYQTLDIPMDKRKKLARELQQIIDNHKRLWVKRNRPGGLQESAGRMQKIHDYYLGK